MTTSPLFKRVCGQWPRHESPAPDALTPFRKQIREWWSFNSAQRHTHSWHTREDFLKRLPEILSECGIHPAASPEPPAEEVETLRAALTDALAFMKDVRDQRGDSGVGILICNAEAALGARAKGDG